MNFIKERDEILKHLTSSELRTVSPVDLKRQLEMIGFTRRCLWCGNALSSQGFCCGDCGKALPLEVHHIVPIRAHNAEGDPFDRHNLVALCKECHTRRGIELNEEYKISDTLRKKKLSTLDRW